MAIAYQEGRILITLDKDFGEIAIVRGQPHCGIIRLVNIAAKQQAAVCLEVLMRYAGELLPLRGIQNSKFKIQNAFGARL